MGTSKGHGITFPLVLAVLVTVIGSTFQYGYNIAVMNGPAKLMQAYFFEGEEAIMDTSSNISATRVPSYTSYVTQQLIAENETNIQNVFTNSYTEAGPQENNLQETETIVLTSSEKFLWAFTVSIYTVGGMIGSFSTGICVKKFGRKGALLASNSLSIVGAILMGTSKAANSLEMIIIARFLLGIFAGLATGIVPLYLGEISPKRIRGGLGVVNQLSITIGILCAQLLSLKEALGTAELWPVLLAFTGVPSVIQLCVLPFLPESPRCLLIDKDREDLARKALIFFRPTPDVGDEIREMREEARAESATEQQTVIMVIKDKTVRWQLLSVVFIQFTQQLCGINAIFFYLNTIFEAAGVAGDAQNYASVGVGTVNVFMTVISVLLMDRLGRKLLLAGGYAVAGLFCIIMTIALNLQDQISWISNLSIACVIGFIIGFAVGPGPVPWILTAELFRQSSRPAASAIGCGVNWTFNFALALVFPFMQDGMGPYVFIFFLFICVIATAYVIIIIPETKGKTFQEINGLFAKRNNVKLSDVEMEESTRHIVREQ
uniref:solute carrier family 2, facilitated glucose transporter member 5-like isoform X2 n=1 Tax=Ciona intestinalis TaxID=7719 RepID=UPI000180C2D0|nr:solute carrier family 2, facilitated glucose transporter member 5-like isoform X2 [Ciona intestinalis]|eukprot:XP_009859000.1 solute carrier family 2, facilitated glucose transporter member 5-like isoform X2 [Ciona intestinalis]